MTYEEYLEKLFSEDERYMLLTAENRAPFRGLCARLGNRFIDVGIAEQTMVGIAAGLALRGRVPIVHAFATFLTMRAFEFIRTDIGVANLPVKLMGAVGGVLSEANGMAHQGLEDISLMRGIPNMRVFAPADKEDLMYMLPEILSSPFPCYVRYTNFESDVAHTKSFEAGKAEVLSEGDYVMILCYGRLLGECAAAAKILNAKGIHAGVVNIRSLKPVDEQLIISAAQKKVRIVTVEDHFLSGGLFTIVAETMAKHNVMTKVFPIAFDGRWFKPALLPDVLEFEKLRGADIAEKIEESEACGRH